MSRYVLGIDPGLKGALCFWAPDDDLIEIFDAPVFNVQRNGKARAELDRYQLGRIVAARAAHTKLAVIEHVSSMPKQGIASAFTFGKVAGMFEMACAAAQIPLLDVAPAAWKRALKLGADKDACRRAASNLAPQHAHLWSRAKDDGRAEAFLLARYGATR
jgi:crossover junction endodeoxyribonuclease RuvC